MTERWCKACREPLVLGPRGYTHQGQDRHAPMPVRHLEPEPAAKRPEKEGAQQ